MKLTAERLIAACDDGSFDAGLRIRTQLEPLAGPNAPIKPAIYEGGRYQLDERWLGEGDHRHRVQVVVIDNVPSQANRLEAALSTIREVLGLPELVLDLSEIPSLPRHLPRQLSSFLFPHRNADAYLRDAALGGKPFLKSEIGKQVFGASADAPEGLFAWMPQALLFGFWQSHLGTKRQQTKLPRSWVSEIAGYEPASTETSVLGLKGDPLNLSIDVAVNYDESDLLTWDVTGAAKSGNRKAKESLAEIGHGQVPVAGARGAISFGVIEQCATVSFASLRRINARSSEASAAGRALLVAIGVAAHQAAFARSFALRSGCDLRPASVDWEFLGVTGDEQVDAPSLDEAIALVRECAAHAESAGLPVGSQWPTEPVRLTPQDKLRKVIEEAWPCDPEV